MIRQTFNPNSLIPGIVAATKYADAVSEANERLLIRANEMAGLCTADHTIDGPVHI